MGRGVLTPAALAAVAGASVWSGGGRLLALLLGSCFGAASPAHAADISLSNRPGCSIELRGPIVDGDAERLDAALAQAVRPPYDYDCAKYADYAVCLDSQGGSFLEARKVAAVIHDQNFATRVDADAICTSACAFAFMAGHFVGEEGCNDLQRTLDIRGQLGFHAPFVLLAPEARVSGQVVNEFLPEYNALLADFARLAAYRPDFELTSTVSFGLWSEFLATPPGEMYMIDTVEKAARWAIALDGIPETRLLSEDEQVQACVNQLAWMYDERSYPATVDDALGSRWIQDESQAVAFMQWYLGGMFRRDCFIEAQDQPTPRVEYCIVDATTGMLLGDCEGPNELDYRLFMPWWHAMPPDMPLGAIR